MDRIYRVAKAMWIVMGSPAYLFDRDWTRSEVFRSEWSRYAQAAIDEADKPT